MKGLAAAALILWAVPACPQSEACRPSLPGSDALWRIVSQCLDTSVPDYCSRCPSPLKGTCGGAASCRATTEVWAKSDAFVAIRDLKMCADGCPAGFVHGLVLPLARVCGEEDPRRPPKIWRFAWDTAAAKIPRQDQIVLAVNPLGARGQNQLHIHLLRFKDDGRARLAALQPTAIAELDDVWNAAEEHARKSGLSAGYGIAVAKAADGKGFLVAAVPGGAEKALGESSCR
jgi:hypothetical protein